MNRRTGFTMVELVVVLSIVALVAGIAVPRLAGSMTHSKADAAARQLALVLSTARSHAAGGSLVIQVSTPVPSRQVHISVLEPATQSPVVLSADEIQHALRADTAPGPAPALLASSGQSSRKATLISLARSLSRTMPCTVSQTQVTITLGHNAVITSAGFAGETSVKFSGHGLASSGGTMVVRVGDISRPVVLDGDTGAARMER